MSLFAKFAMAAKTAADVTLSAAAGDSLLAEPSTQRARQYACNQCPQLQSNGRCALCGCMVQLKARLAAASCPAHRWQS